MIYELRIYDCVPGKLPDLHRRFNDVTLKIWQRYDIQQAGFWTTVLGENNQRLYYLLAWQSLAEREQKWDAFMADEEWQRERAASEQAGAIVANVSSQILTPTAYSTVQ